MFNDAFDRIKNNRDRRLRGEQITIPFPFDRFSRYYPGIEKRRYIICTASPKVGKTKFTDFLFLYNPIEMMKRYGLKVKIFYFSLEMSKEDKIMEMISYFLYKRTGITLSTDQLSSLYGNYITQKEVLDIIETEIKPLVEEVEQYVTFIDNVRNPYGIYKTVREYAHNNGNYIDKDGIVIPMKDIESDDEEIQKVANQRIEKYVANEPEEYVLIITDHISLLTPEAEDRGDIRSAMGRFSSNYCIKMRDRWSYIPVNVQQQAAAQEGVENVKASMVRPSANGLADNKTTARDVDLLLGLFAPARLEIKDWQGYNIMHGAAGAQIANVHNIPLGHNFRELSIIYSRRGSSDIYAPLYFNGASNYFSELPKPNDHTTLNIVGKKIVECNVARNNPKEHVQQKINERKN